MADRHGAMRGCAWGVALIALAGCTALRDRPAADSGARDGGRPRDTGEVGTDARLDTGAIDTGPLAVDGGPLDGGRPDAGPRDGGRPDAGCAARETACSDRRDEDCDSQLDCDDPDCDQQQCGPSSWQRCCRDSCRDFFADFDHANCGACDVACAADQACNTTGTGIPVCSCNVMADCRGGMGWACSSNLCSCDTAAVCAAGQTCSPDATLGRNVCRY